MKYIAAIMVGLLLPFTFASPASAAHLDVVMKNVACSDKGDTVVTMKVFNKSSRYRKMNWSRSTSTDGGVFGFDVVNKQVGFRFSVPAEETVTISVWSRLNQKTLLFRKKVTALSCDI